MVLQTKTFKKEVDNVLSNVLEKMSELSYEETAPCYVGLGLRYAKFFLYVLCETRKLTRGFEGSINLIYYLL